MNTYPNLVWVDLVSNVTVNRWGGSWGGGGGGGGHITYVFFVSTHSSINFFFCRVCCYIFKVCACKANHCGHACEFTGCVCVCVCVCVCAHV